MAHRITWSKRAVQDLDAITAYIAADSPAYASIVLKNVVKQTRILADFPRAGRRVPEFDDEWVRELVLYSYRIIYRLQDDEALIVAVIHGKRILQQARAPRFEWSKLDGLRGRFGWVFRRICIQHAVLSG